VRVDAPRAHGRAGREAAEAAAGDGDVDVRRDRRRREGVRGSDDEQRREHHVGQHALGQPFFGDRIVRPLVQGVLELLPTSARLGAASG
jgi:hypothetical protein